MTAAGFSGSNRWAGGAGPSRENDGLQISQSCREWKPEVRRRSASFDNAWLYGSQTRNGRRRFGGKAHRDREASVASVGAREQVQRVFPPRGMLWHGNTQLVLLFSPLSSRITTNEHPWYHRISFCFVFPCSNDLLKSQVHSKHHCETINFAAQL